MTSIAYLVIEIENNRLVNAGIYSEPHPTTRLIPGRKQHMFVSRKGKDYASAEKSLRVHVTQTASRYAGTSVGKQWTWIAERIQRAHEGSGSLEALLKLSVTAHKPQRPRKK